MEYNFNGFKFAVSEKHKITHGDAIMILKHNQNNIERVLPALDLIVNDEINDEHRCLNREDCWKLLKLLYKHMSKEGK